MTTGSTDGPSATRRLAGPGAAGRRPGRAPAGRDDARGEGRPARQPLGRQRHAGRGRHGRPATEPDDDAQRRADAGRLRRRRAPSRWRRRAGTGSATSPGSTAACRSPRPRARPSWSASSASCSTAPGWASRRCPRGVPDRLHHVRRDGLPGGDRLGRDVRPRPGRADGRRDRPRHGRGRRAPGALAGARRGARLPLGPGRGDDGRGPVPGRDARRRLRPRPAERRRHRHPQALRRLLGLPRRPATTGRCRWAGASCWTSSCRRSRRPSPLGRRRLGDELLLRRRRRAGRRRPVAAHRAAARASGASPARWSPTTGRCRSSPPCTGSPRTPTTPARRRSPPASTSSCPTPSASAPGLVERVRARRAARGARRPGRPPAAHPEGRSSACSTRTGRRRARWPARPPSTSTRRPTGRWPARWPSGRSSCSTPGTALPLLGDGRPALRRVAVVGPCAADPRTFMGCYAFPNHVLPRYPGLGLGIEVPTVVDALRAELPDAEVVLRAGLRGAGRRTGPASPPRSPRPADADLCVAVVGDLAGLFGHGTSGEGCDAEDLRLPGVQADLLDELLATGTPVVVVVVSGRPYALGDVHGRAAGLVQAFMPGEEGGRGDRRRALRPGPARRQAAGADPADARAASRAPTCSRRWASENAGISTLDPTPLFPFGHGALVHHASRSDDLRISARRGAHRRRVHGLGPGPQHRRAGRRRGRPALPARRRRARWPGRCKQLTGFARVRLEPGAAADVRVPRARRPHRVHRPGPAAHRRAGRHRGARRHLGGRPALPRHGPAHRPDCGSSATTAGSPPRSTLSPVAGRRRRRVGEDVVPARDGRTTLATVAASAGVSVATVSKVLNGRADVAPATRALVQDLLQPARLRRPAARARARRRPPHRSSCSSHGDLNAYSTEILQGVARRGGRASASPSRSALRARGRDGRRPTARGLGPRPGRRRPPGGHRRGQRPDRGGPARAGPGPAAARRHRPAQHAARPGDQRRLDQLRRRSGRDPAPAVAGAPADRLPRRSGRGGVQPGPDARLPRRDGGRRRADPGGVRADRPASTTRTASPAGAALLDLPEPPTAVFAGSDETAAGRDRGGPGPRAAGPRGPERGRVRRHPAGPAARRRR